MNGVTTVYLSGAQFILAIVALVLIGVAIGRSTAPSPDRWFLRPVRGEHLDRIADGYNVKRKRWLFGLLKESDRKLRLRVERVVKNDRREWR